MNRDEPWRAWPPRVRHIRHLRVVLLAAALLGVACSSTSGTASTSGAASTNGPAGGTAVGTAPGTAPGAPPGTTATAAATVEQFAGTAEDFYKVPIPLPAAAPGTLIRTMPVDAPAGEAGLRIMYHSTDDRGRDRAVTGVLYHPTTAPPAGGWPIVAWAHGTSGLAAACAPSRKPSAPPAFGVQGVRVATDYIGLGPEGEVHPYLSAAAEGHAVIDSVVAARNLPQTGAGTEWLVAGVSQGGHAALVTSEQAAQRLPDVRLVGTVAIAPGSQLGETYGDDLQARIITAMVLVGIEADDPSVHPSDYLSAAALPAADLIRTKCVQDIIGSALPLSMAPDFYTVDPRTSPLGKAWLAKNDPGQVKSDAPLLLVQGGKDLLVLPPRTAALFQRLCALGQVVQQLAIPEGTHDTVTNLAKDQIVPWVAARFAGQPATNDC